MQKIPLRQRTIGEIAVRSLLISLPVLPNFVPTNLYLYVELLERVWPLKCAPPGGN